MDEWTWFTTSGELYFAIHNELADSIGHASMEIAHVQRFILISSFLCPVNRLPQAVRVA